MDIIYLKTKFDDEKYLYNSDEIIYLINHCLYYDISTDILETNIKLSHILTNMTVTDNFKLNDICFEYISTYNLLEITQKYLDNNKIYNVDQYFNMFCYYILSLKNKNNFPHIFLALLKKITPGLINNSHIDMIIKLNHDNLSVEHKKIWIDCYIFVVDKMKIIPNNYNFNNYINMIVQKKYYYDDYEDIEDYDDYDDYDDYLDGNDLKNNKLNKNEIDEIEKKNFQIYFSKIKFTKWHLYIACKNGLYNIINIIINNKIIPDNLCINTLINWYKSTYINTTIPLSIYKYDAYKAKKKEYFDKIKNKFALIIDIFIDHSYELSHDDIINISKIQIKLIDNIYTKNFIPNKTFYDCCDFEFCPKYNNNMFCDMLWLSRMCTIAKTLHDYDIIQRYLTKYKLKLNYDNYIILKNNRNTHNNQFPKNKFWDDIIKNIDKN
jgi:hypothetical protein